MKKTLGTRTQRKALRTRLAILLTVSLVGQLVPAPRIARALDDTVEQEFEQVVELEGLEALEALEAIDAEEALVTEAEELFEAAEASEDESDVADEQAGAAQDEAECAVAEAPAYEIVDVEDDEDDAFQVELSVPAAKQVTTNERKAAGEPSGNDAPAGENDETDPEPAEDTKVIEVTVKADDVTKAYGTDDPELTVTFEGLGEDELVEAQDAITYTITRDAGELAGSYKIHLSGAAEQGSYHVTFDDNDAHLLISGGEADPIFPGDVIEITHDDKTYAFGETITWNVKVTNIYNKTNDIMLAAHDGIKLAKTSFRNVEPGKSVTTTATYQVAEKDVLGGDVFNITDVTFAHGTPVVGSDLVPAAVEAPKVGLAVSDTVTSEPDNGSTYVPGEKITYKLVVSNTGNVTLSDVSVEDIEDYAAGSAKITSSSSKGLTVDGSNATIAKIAPGASRTIKVSYEAKDDDVNVKLVNRVLATCTVPTFPEDPEMPVAPGDDPVATDAAASVKVTAEPEEEQESEDAPSTRQAPAAPATSEAAAPTTTTPLAPASVTPSTPAATDAEQTETTPTPTAEVTAPVATPEQISIEDAGNPLTVRDTWALVNLLCALLTCLISVAQLLGADERRSSLNVVSLLPAIASVALFLLTERLSNPMGLADGWTPIMALVLAGQVALAVVARRQVAASHA